MRKVTERRSKKLEERGGCSADTLMTLTRIQRQMRCLLQRMRTHRETLIREGAPESCEIIAASRIFYARVQQLNIERRLRLGAFVQIEGNDAELRTFLAQEVHRYTSCMETVALHIACDEETACLMACASNECAKLMAAELGMAQRQVSSAVSYMSRIAEELLQVDQEAPNALRDLLLRHIEGIAEQSRPEAKFIPSTERSRGPAQATCTVQTAPRCLGTAVAPNGPAANRRMPPVAMENRWLHEGPPFSLFSAPICRSHAAEKRGAPRSNALSSTESWLQPGPAPRPCSVAASSSEQNRPGRSLDAGADLREEPQPEQEKASHDKKAGLAWLQGQPLSHTEVTCGRAAWTPPFVPPGFAAFSSMTRLCVDAEGEQATSRGSLYVMLCHYRDQSAYGCVQIAWGEQLRFVEPGPPLSGMVRLQQLATGARVCVPEIMTSKLSLVVWGAAPRGACVKVAMQYFEPAWQDGCTTGRPRFQVGDCVVLWEEVTQEMSAAFVHEETPGFSQALPVRIPLMILHFASLLEIS